MEAIKVNLIPNGIPEACHASQYDEGRQIRLDLFDGLTPYTIQAGDTFTLNVRKPDNHVITETVTGTEGNTYLVIETSEQMTAVTGENLCEIRLENGGDNIGSLNFIMQVEKDVIANGIPSESVIEDLQALVVEAVGDNYYTKTETDELLSQKADVTDLLDLLPTDNASGAIANFTDGADNVPVKALSVEFAASQASGTPTPSTPIPIVGVDKVNITRTGKNLLGGSKLLANAQAYLPSGTTDLVNKTFIFTAWAIMTEGLSFTTGLKFKENTQYTFIFVISKEAGTGTNLRVLYTDGTSDNIGIITETATKTTIIYKTNANKTIDSIIKYNSSSRTTLYYDECGIFEGDLSATDFEPYNGTTALINLGGTYYGGSVDAVTGKITLTHQLVVFDGTENWVYYASTGCFYLENAIDVTSTFKTSKNVPLCICNSYKEETSITNSAELNNREDLSYLNQSGSYYKRLWVKNTAITSVEDFKTTLSNNPIQLVYPLATPIVVYASNTAEIPTILGVNNIFSDAGDVDVTYRADIALYIQKMLGGNANRSLAANPSILRTGAISTDIEVSEPVEPDSEPVELEREVTEQPENEGNDNEER